MATNIPPHNLDEIVEACELVIEDPEVPFEELLEVVRGPDFPTGGLIYGSDGIRNAYETGRGRVVMRARAEIEELEGDRSRIIVTEIPYQVNKTRIIEQIAGLVREKRVTDVSDMRDESDRDGIRLVVELKRGANPRIVLNQLFKHTQMQSTFGVIMLALVDGVPRVMPLREMLRHFVDHRHEVVVRRSEFDLRNAKEREHILEGLEIAVQNIEEVVEIIRAAIDPDEAGERLRERFDLTEEQSAAILDMRLGRLTGLEIEKLEEELEEVRADVERLEAILASRERRMSIVKEELRECAEKYGDDRRTEIVDVPVDFTEEDLIAEETMVITVSRHGYVKRIPTDVYRNQRRGGRGVAGMGIKEDDWVEHLFLASTHDFLMFFTEKGHGYWLKVYEIPKGGRTARGRPIVNLLRIDSEETIASTVPVKEFSEDRYLTFATRGGKVKKTSLAAYSNVRSPGINAINIVEGDRLIDVQMTDGSNDVLLATRQGKAIRFHEEDVREMGRATQGVKGVDLAEGDEVVGMVVVRREGSLLTVTTKGMGKRTDLEDYRTQRRGGKGLINQKLSDKTGEVVGVKEVTDEDEVMLVTRNGVINRQPARDVRVIGRNTQGVKLVNLDDGDRVVDVARVVDRVEDDGEPAEGDEPDELSAELEEAAGG